MERGKRGKRGPISIDRQQPLAVDPALLPSDAVFKGYEEVLVQDVRIRTDNVLFRKEVWYAPSTGQSYRAPLPRGYHGEFGPGIHALVLVLAFGCLVSEAKIRELLTNVGVQIADGTISNLLIKNQTAFHTEADAVVQAGLQSSPWQQIDDTGTRVNGQNQHCQIVCNPLYTSYRTTAAKDRLSVLDVLRGDQPRRFRLNAEALGYLDQVQVAQVTRATVGPALGHRSGRADAGSVADDPPANAWPAGPQMDHRCSGGGRLPRPNRLASGAVAGV